MTLVDYVFTKLRPAQDVDRQVPKESRFRRSYDKKHDKRPHTLLKSEGLHLKHIY